MLRKRDTSRGFTTPVPTGDSITGPNRACLRLDGQLDESILSPRIHHAILTMARLRNVVSSLRQEGVPVDFHAARDALDGKRTTRPAEQEVLRFAKEYEALHEADRLPALTKSYILKLHGRLYAGYNGDAYRPGRLKAEQNGVGPFPGYWTFECTPPERTETELDALLEWYKANRSSEPAVGVASTFFAEFQCIHPFHDGNGRIGRVLNAHVLKDLGFHNISLVPLDARFFRSGETYYTKIASTNTGTTWIPWANYYAAELRKAYEAAAKMGSLDGLLAKQSTESARHVLAWAISRGDEWFQRNEVPHGDYQPGTISVALRDLRASDALEMTGDKKGARYRIKTELLQDIFRGAV